MLSLTDSGGDGLPLLLVHGFPHRAKFWAPLVAELPPRVRAIAPDLPGFGDSPPGAGPASMDAYADACVEVLDGLGVERAAVAGLSMGGYVALALWRRHRTRVRALALLDTRAGADGEEAKGKRRDTIAQARRDGAAAVAASQLAGSVGRTTRAERGEVADALEELMATASVEGIVAATEAMLARPDSTPTLATIDVPTLVVVGEEDALTPPKEARALHEGIKGSGLVVIPRAGHTSAFERPVEVASAIVAWLDDAERAGLGGQRPPGIA